MNKTHQSQKSHPKKDTKNLRLTVSIVWVPNLLTDNIAHKSTEKTPINDQGPNQHVAEVECRGVETSFCNFIGINRSEKLNSERKLWVWNRSKSPHRHLYQYFFTDKLHSIQNGIGSEMEWYLKYNNVFRLKHGHEKHGQCLESKKNSTVEVFDYLSRNIQLPAEHNAFDLGTRNSI